MVDNFFFNNIKYLYSGLDKPLIFTEHSNNKKVQGYKDIHNKKTRIEMIYILLDIVLYKYFF